MNFEAHQRPNLSRLESWRDEITAMRAAQWPYRRIAKWLQEEQLHQVSATAIRNFCLIREIPKGGTKEPTKPKPERQSLPKRKPVASPEKKKFTYDDSGPIALNKSEPPSLCPSLLSE